MVTTELKYIVKTAFFRELSDTLELRNAAGIRERVWGPVTRSGCLQTRVSAPSSSCRGPWLSARRRSPRGIRYVGHLGQRQRWQACAWNTLRRNYCFSVSFSRRKNCFSKCLYRKKKTLVIRMPSSASLCVQGVWVLRRVQGVSFIRCQMRGFSWENQFKLSSGACRHCCLAAKLCLMFLQPHGL